MILSNDLRIGWNRLHWKHTEAHVHRQVPFWQSSPFIVPYFLIFFLSHWEGKHEPIDLIIYMAIWSPQQTN